MCNRPNISTIYRSKTDISMIADIVSNITDIGYIEDISTDISDIFIPVDVAFSSSTTVESDVNTSQKLTSILSNEFNYLHWSRALVIALGGRSRLGFVNDKEKAPMNESQEYEAWLAKDQMVMSWILNPMERNI